MDSSDARQALDQVTAAQVRMAESVADCPPWRHALFGGLFFALIGSISISSAVQLATAPFILIAAVLIMKNDRRRKGVFVNGYRRGATLPVTLLLVLVMVGLVYAAMKLRYGDYGLGAKFALAVLAFALATGFSVYWNRIFRLELKAGAR